MKILKIVLLFLAVSSCSNDVPITDLDLNPDIVNYDVECIEDKYSSSIEGCALSSFPLEYCIIETQSSDWMSDKSKSFGQFICEEIGQEIQFKDNAGNILTMVLAECGYGNSQIACPKNELCNEDPDIPYYSCVPIDEISGKYDFLENDESLIIKIHPDYEEGYFKVDKYFDAISIWSNYGSSDSNEFELITKLVTDIKDSELVNLNESVEIPEIILDGKNIKKVYESHLSPLFSSFKYYFTRENGLVGFVNQNNTLWVRID